MAKSDNMTEISSWRREEAQAKMLLMISAMSFFSLARYFWKNACAKFLKFIRKLMAALSQLFIYLNVKAICLSFFGL